MERDGALADGMLAAALVSTCFQVVHVALEAGARSDEQHVGDDDGEADEDGDGDGHAALRSRVTNVVTYFT